jgi:hypothetical protein
MRGSRACATGRPSVVFGDDDASAADLQRRFAAFIAFDLQCATRF